MNCKQKVNSHLELAKQIARQAEARAESQSIIRGESNVDAVQKSKSQHQSKPVDKKQIRKCYNCGYEHPPENCPAKNAECHFCKKIGHFRKVCKKRLRLAQVREIHDHHTYEEEEDFLGELHHINAVDDNSWSAEVKVNGKLTSSKLDTGASV